MRKIALLTLLATALPAWASEISVHCSTSKSQPNPHFNAFTASLQVGEANKAAGKIDFTGGEKISLAVEGTYFAGVYMAPARFDLNPAERNSIFGAIQLFDGDAPNGTIVVDGLEQRLVCRPFE